MPKTVKVALLWALLFFGFWIVMLTLGGFISSIMGGFPLSKFPEFLLKAITHPLSLFAYFLYLIVPALIIGIYKLFTKNNK